MRTILKIVTAKLNQAKEKKQDKINQIETECFNDDVEFNKVSKKDKQKRISQEKISRKLFNHL